MGNVPVCSTGSGLFYRWSETRLFYTSACSTGALRPRFVLHP